MLCVHSWQMSIVIYHSVDSRPDTAEANVSLLVNELPRYVQGARHGECFALASVDHLMMVMTRR